MEISVENSCRDYPPDRRRYRTLKLRPGVRPVPLWGGATLLVCGDDTELYIFRQRIPMESSGFRSVSEMSSHILSDCFRCTRRLSHRHNTLIHGPRPDSKVARSLDDASSPPVAGQVKCGPSRLRRGGKSHCSILPGARERWMAGREMNCDPDLRSEATA